MFGILGTKSEHFSPHFSLVHGTKQALSQSPVAPRLPPIREPPPRTPRSPPHILALRRSRTPPTRSLHACNDDATLSILATETLNIRIHMLSY